ESAVAVDCDAETESVPKVTLAVLAIVMLSVASVAVKVTVSATVSVAVKVATPDPLVVTGVVGRIEALSVPARVTDLPAIDCGGVPWSRNVTVMVVVVVPSAGGLSGEADTPEFEALTAGA